MYNIVNEEHILSDFTSTIVSENWQQMSVFKELSAY